MSFWEAVGEKVGYGLAAIIYGPRVALEQRHKRTIRRAFAAWLGDEKFTKQVAEAGRVRRLVERQSDELSFLLECELHPEIDRAYITIRLEKLPHMKEDHVLVEDEAPESAAEWDDLATGAVKKAAETIRRHRGDGYR
jgi:hypothetical protein